MDRTSRVTLTNMCMITDGDRVLVQNRSKPEWPGVTFPGGHVEPGESITASVIREVQEETGLLIEAPRLCGVKDWMEDDGSRYIVFLYQTDRFKGELASSDEGEVYWLNKKDMKGVHWAITMEDMLEVFMRDEVSEFYYYQQDGQWAYTLL